ncbi:S-type pyocin domain-containing protein [Brenneria goodwinii]|uniref:S-type pyocin domain-containing protein n=1 Tax=Brenneria goodwinii TaxID=1109412 RepID=UPI000EF18CB5|nr:S-type pyocin domain-containing protein [Brenneria goodwinii]MCG8155919.1 S-type pyocin domain-containing protein [Brenneria goodwinii]MCG8162312.1 S-type pyocin domain-containing protein [Brenneria goodwinii]MCG8166967.1 S-type pyocin domain-containing protein [Brenneria goodwinii]MCG8169641.1 S-type pyocin domain-containing protein [Brenneria goodwinii]MCG8174753.1 S-type pyocin domain-containing protein [Brenneria goodwinii]
MSRQLAKLGDKTTSGGQIISATSGFSDNGISLVMTGDMALCPKCKGAFQIMGTAIHWSSIGKTHVATGDRVLCRCPNNQVIANTSYWVEDLPKDPFGTQAKLAASPPAPAVQPAPVKPVPPPVFAKSCLRGAGCNDAGTTEEPQENFATMSFYQSLPFSPSTSSTPSPTADSETVQYAQTAKKKQPATGKAEAAAPEKKKSLFDKVTGFFFGEAEAMPLPPPPVVMGGSAQAGMAASAGGAMGKANQDAAQALTHRMKHLSGPKVWQGRIAMNLPFVVMGVVLQSMLKGEKSDLLTADNLLAVAGRKGTVPTRVRYRWEDDLETGRLKAVGYHTGPDSGRDRVKVRLLEKNLSGGYEFWEDGELSKPLITWTPADAPGSSDAEGWHTGNDSAPVGTVTVTVPGLEYPDTHDVRVTTTPAPEEKDFRDYILVFPGNAHPPIYVYLSKPPVEFLEVKPYRDFNGRTRQRLYHVDHMPSRQAVVLYLKREFPDIHPDKIKAMVDQVAAIAVPEKVHRQDSATYGGRNRSQMGPDSHNLRAAIDKDFDQIKPVLMQDYGATEAALEAARKEMHRINTELGLYK